MTGVRSARRAVAAGLMILLGGWVAASPAGLTTLSIVGTTDLHGYVFPRDGAGGVALLGGYLARLRAARHADGGGVVLVDAGDTWLGGVESNMSEGAVVVDAYNALGYTAAAVGNHDLEFGAVDPWWARPGQVPDLRGALKARAQQARYPFLAANLVDTATGQPVDWPNVRRSALVEIAGVKVGLVGVMTIDALSMTLAPNVVGLATAPLAPAIAREATFLRGRGAQVVVVVTHAGGWCSSFATPDDVSSCDAASEIFEVARALPAGLVDAIAAGHTHEAIAHRVAGIPIAQAWSWGRAFSRIDLSVRRATGRVEEARVFPPQDLCAWRDTRTGRCAPAPGPDVVAAEYEGGVVTADAAVARAMAPALTRIRAVRDTALGPALEAPLVRGPGDGDSPLGNVFADAIRAAVPGATVALSYGAGPGGLRADLGVGPVTVGAVYDAFPYDNRIEVRRLTGAELARLIGDHMARPRFRSRALGLSGVRVSVACADGRDRVTLTDGDGRALADDAPTLVAMTDFLASRVRALNLGEAVPMADAPLLRDAAATWIGTRRASDLVTLAASPRWSRAPGTPASCTAP